MLIIEGTDLAGKTTLAKTLVEKLNVIGHGHVYQHLSRLPEAFDHYHGYCSLAGPNQVRDRFHMSELAYTDARIKCGSPECWLTSPEQYRLVDGMLRQFGTYTVLLTVDHGLLVERFDKQGDDMYDVDIVTAANDSFHELARNEFAAMDVTIDVDQYYHLTNEKPYVTEDEADDIIRDYTNRQRIIEHLLS